MPKNTLKKLVLNSKRANKQSKMWIFFEINEVDRSSTVRGIALDKEAKDRFEISLTEEMRIRNKGKKKKFWWTVEENLTNHLFASEMYEASRVALRNWKKYKVGNREIDGD